MHTLWRVADSNNIFTRAWWLRLLRGIFSALPHFLHAIAARSAVSTSETPSVGSKTSMGARAALSRLALPNAPDGICAQGCWFLLS